jgi:hypothetical protein
MITIYQRPPIYLDPSFTDYSNVEVRLNHEAQVFIPAFEDPDGSACHVEINDAYSVKVIFSLASDFSSVTFSPTSFNEVGVHMITLDIVDEAGSKLSKSFKVTVINEAPYFTKPLTEQKVALNEVKEIEIKDIYDREFHTIYMSFTRMAGGYAYNSLPIFASFVSPHSLRIAPTEFSEIGIYTFRVDINDTVLRNFSEFNVVVFNTAPYFINEQPTELNVRLNDTTVYQMPAYKDNEGH